MNRTTIVAVVVAFLGTALAVAAGEPPSKAARIARGKYLVEQVGMCSDCHSPRDEKGNFIEGKWLQGSPLFFKATVPMPKWADVAPPIAGLPGWSDAEAITLLTAGKDQKGEPPDPPMPQFRFTKEDATAVVAYLRSIGPKSK